MSELSLITADIAAVRADVMDALFGDTYQITRGTRTTNSRGQPVDTPGVVESGPCRLIELTGGAAERLSGGAVTVGIVGYQAQLPITTTLKASDTLTINGRTYRVIGLHAGGALDVFPVADLQAWDEDN